MLNLEKSAAAFAEAKTLMPGGVNSPVRSWRGVGGTPLFFQRGEGRLLVWSLVDTRSVSTSIV